MKVKLIFCIAILATNLAFGSSFYEPSHKSFKEGFNAGLQALEFQAKVDGYKQKSIQVNKPYLLVFEIKNTPLNEALFLQIIAFKEGFDTHLSKNFVSFGEFDRLIDAQDKKKELERKFKLNASAVKIYTNITSFLTYPFLWQDFHSVLVQDAIRAGVIYEEKEKIVYKTIYKETKKPAVKKVKETTKKFTLKNAKAMSYKLIGKDNENYELDSLNYAENALLNKKEYEFEREITTRQGEKFVKVKDENLYFSSLDVELKQ